MNANIVHLKTNSVHRALVIDDDKFMLTVLEDMLRDLGVVHITTATSGTAGIQAYDRAAQVPDVVLCDLSMPQSDGFDFMEQLSTRRFGGGIILVSGMDARTLNSASLMARFHRLNILATLAKPVDASALASALSKLK